MLSGGCWTTAGQAGAQTGLALTGDDESAGQGASTHPLLVRPPQGPWTVALPSVVNPKPTSLCCRSFERTTERIVFATPLSKQGLVGPVQRLGELHHSPHSCSFSIPRAVFPELQESNGVEEDHECECTLVPGHSGLQTQGGQPGVQASWDAS